MKERLVLSCLVEVLPEIALGLTGFTVIGGAALLAGVFLADKITDN